MKKGRNGERKKKEGTSGKEGGINKGRKKEMKEEKNEEGRPARKGVRQCHIYPRTPLRTHVTPQMSPGWSDRYLVLLSVCPYWLPVPLTLYRSVLGWIMVKLYSDPLMPVISLPGLPTWLYTALLSIYRCTRRRSSRSSLDGRMARAHCLLAEQGRGAIDKNLSAGKKHGFRFDPKVH